MQLYGRLFIATVQAKEDGNTRMPAHFNVGITWVRSYQSAVESPVMSLPRSSIDSQPSLTPDRGHCMPSLARSTTPLNIRQCFSSTLLPFTQFVHENVRRDCLQSFTCTNSEQCPVIWRILVSRRQAAPTAAHVRARSPGPRSDVFTSVRGLKYYLDEFQDSKGQYCAAQRSLTQYAGRNKPGQNAHRNDPPCVM